MHLAVFAGTAAEFRPKSLNDAITVRYYLEDDPGCLAMLPSREPLKSLLPERGLLKA